MPRDPEQNLVVVVSRQEVLLHEKGLVSGRWDVSTSRFGLGSKEGSFRTPTGRFRICEKIGDGAPSGMIFKSRIPTGQLARIGADGGDEDLVLTRILWLEGLDPENANTRDRYIYFHGTNREDLIGTPSSHGCIRLRNAEMIDLYDRVATGTRVEIREDDRDNS
jgi:lipoprotein-anchoring transpeptidase ErfK/SrfK